MTSEDTKRLDGLPDLPYEPEIDDPLAAVAQGVINIDSGYTTIEPNSTIYKGMLALIELRRAGRLVLRGEGRVLRKPVKP